MQEKALWHTVSCPQDPQCLGWHMFAGTKSSERIYSSTRSVTQLQRKNNGDRAAYTARQESVKNQSNDGKRAEAPRVHAWALRTDTSSEHADTHTAKNVCTLHRPQARGADAAVIVSDGSCCCPVCAAKQARCPRRHSDTVAGQWEGKAHHEAYHDCGTAAVG